MRSLRSPSNCYRPPVFNQQLCSVRRFFRYEFWADSVFFILCLFPRSLLQRVAVIVLKSYPIYLRKCQNGLVDRCTALQVLMSYLELWIRIRLNDAYNLHVIVHQYGVNGILDKWIFYDSPMYLTHPKDRTGPHWDHISDGDSHKADWSQMWEYAILHTGWGPDRTIDWIEEYAVDKRSRNDFGSHSPAVIEKLKRWAGNGGSKGTYLFGDIIWGLGISILCIPPFYGLSMRILGR